MFFLKLTVALMLFGNAINFTETSHYNKEEETYRIVYWVSVVLWIVALFIF